MSPFRLVPLQVLQDNSLNTDQLQDAVSQTPCDEDPRPVHLLELLDLSISNQFSEFDFPRWELLHPELPTYPPNESAEDDIPTPDFGHSTPQTDEIIQAKKEISDLTPSHIDGMVLEVPDSPPEIPAYPPMPQTWQTVPNSEIGPSTLPTPLEPPVKLVRNPQFRSGSKPPPPEPSEGSTVKKRRRV